MSQQIEERIATNRCRCGCLLSNHKYNEALDKLPCKSEACRCGNFGRHTKEEYTLAGII